MVYLIGLLHQLKLDYEIPYQLFSLISQILGNKQLSIVLDVVLRESSNFGPNLFLLYINGLPSDVSCKLPLPTRTMIGPLICDSSLI